MADQDALDPLINIAKNAVTLGTEDAAFAEDRRSNLPGGGNGPADAYRHTLRAAELYRRFPDAYASAFLDFREFAGGATNTPMDYHNNDVGKVIGQYAQEHELDAVQTRDLVRETIQKSLSDYTPQTIDQEWTPTEGGPLQSPHQTVTLDNGLVVNSVRVMPSSAWGSAENKNWPDADGAWLSRFGEEKSDYFKPPSHEPGGSMLGDLIPPETPTAAQAMPYNGVQR